MLPVKVESKFNDFAINGSRDKGYQLWKDVQRCEEFFFFLIWSIFDYDEKYPD